MIQLLCSKCGLENNRQNQRYCLTCHNAYMREWRKTHKLTGDAKIRDIARHYAGTYLRRGLIEKKPCLWCSSENSQMHHEDYSFPLKVEWLCRPCHLAHHQRGLP